MYQVSVGAKRTKSREDLCLAKCNFVLHRPCNNALLYVRSLYVVHFKAALNFGEAQVSTMALISESKNYGDKQCPALWLGTKLGFEALHGPVPTKNSVQPMGDVIPPTGPQSAQAVCGPA